MAIPAAFSFLGLGLAGMAGHVFFPLDKARGAQRREAGNSKLKASCEAAYVIYHQSIDTYLRYGRYLTHRTLD